MTDPLERRTPIARRQFLQLSAVGTGIIGVRDLLAQSPQPSLDAALREPLATRQGKRAYSGVYTGERLNRIAFPLGGLGAGMVCLEGTGALSHVSVRNQPDVFNAPLVFAALGVKDQPALARVLEAD